MVSQCTICEKFKRNIQKEPLVQDSNPGYLFQRVAIDLFEMAGHDYISIIDAYSGFIISEKLSRKTSSHIIEVIVRIFDRVGYPSEIRCDNSPFGSVAFEKFANEANILFTFSSPRYPQSNGLAEKGVAITKNLLRRCYEVHETDRFQYRILEYNTTQVATMKLSPAQLFFGRQIKTRLPVASQLLYRSNINEVDIQEKGVSIRCKLG